MKREPEPELMTGAEQVRAYAEADFDEPHEMFIDALAERIDDVHQCRHVLDLGCGPADISIRFAKRFRDCDLHVVDGSSAMLAHAATAIDKAGLENRFTLFEQVLPKLELPRPDYDLIISNSLLHHLHQPDQLWHSIISYCRDGTNIFIMDLMRPESIAMTGKLVQRYAGEEPGILQQDFYNSLRAAFTPEEVNVQLHACKLGYLEIEILSDRHLCVSGTYFSH